MVVHDDAAYDTTYITTNMQLTSMAKFCILLLPINVHSEKLFARYLSDTRLLYRHASVV